MFHFLFLRSFVLRALRIYTRNHSIKSRSIIIIIALRVRRRQRWKHTCLLRSHSYFVLFYYMKNLKTEIKPKKRNENKDERIRYLVIVIQCVSFAFIYSMFIYWFSLSIFRCFMPEQEELMWKTIFLLISSIPLAFICLAFGCYETKLHAYQRENQTRVRHSTRLLLNWIWTGEWVSELTDSMSSLILMKISK